MSTSSSRHSSLESPDVAPSSPHGSLRTSPTPPAASPFPVPGLTLQKLFYDRCNFLQDGTPKTHTCQYEDPLTRERCSFGYAHKTSLRSHRARHRLIEKLAVTAGVLDRSNASLIPSRWVKPKGPHSLGTLFPALAQSGRCSPTASVFCRYVDPLTGAPCTRKFTAKDSLQKHIVTVHIYQESRAVAVGLIDRSMATTLPHDWVIGSITQPSLQKKAPGRHNAF
ncbi:hypothetical protein FRC12_001067 [Ceratobasidium sp. 428]|nr:hypothetical protein FRC09_007615 [Ceratobasidium sp. 395]KAG8776153.1 hypothetical protein FRC12_001067 [Ceratobasidium sp. 428]